MVAQSVTGIIGQGDNLFFPCERLHDDADWPEDFFPGNLYALLDTG